MPCVFMNPAIIRSRSLSFIDIRSLLTALVIMKTHLRKDIFFLAAIYFIFHAIMKLIDGLHDK